MRIWKKTALGLACGWALAASSAQAELPRLADDLQIQNAESPLDAALEDEGFQATTPTPSSMPVHYWRSSRRFGLPPMMGDFFPGYTGGVQQVRTPDRLFIVADDLDAPATLPPGNQPLTITEPGPVGIFRSSITSIQDIQATLRAGQMLPTATQAGMVNADATLTTAGTISEVQGILASTPGVAFDIIPLNAPPGSYLSAVDAVFQATNTGGVTTFNGGASGALLQGGADSLNGGEDLDAFYFYDYIVTVNLPTPSAGTGGVGRSRIAENGTTTPQDRLYFDYGYFNSVGFVAGGANVNRYTPGFEKTIADGLGSVEVRLPFASTVDDNIFENGQTSKDDLRFGNISVYLKGLLHETQDYGVAGGLGVIFPTADGVDVTFVDGGRLLEIDNESYHLQPFLSGYYAPNDRFFTQAFAQLDFDLNGNPVAIDSGSGLQDAGRLHDATYLFLDWSAGYWIRRGANAPILPISSFHEHGQVTQSDYEVGIAPTVELHFARSLESADSVSAGPIQVGNFADDVATLTMVLGTNIEIGPETNIGLGYATPLAGGNDEPFKGAFRLTYNRFFGRK